MEYTTWHKLTSVIDEDKFGANFQVAGFYQASNNKRHLGRYFGVTNHWRANIVQDNIWVSSPDMDAQLYPTDVFHNFNNAEPEKLWSKLTFRPKQESYGVRIDYHQKLDQIYKGLYLKVNMPIVRAKNSLGYTSTANTKQHLAVGSALTGVSKSFLDYLAGNVVNNDTNNKQVALNKAKFKSTDSNTAIADIDVLLGYNFLYEDTKHVSANIAATIPTGNKPKGDYLWEAVVGNNKHFALGAGMEGAFKVWEDGNKCLDFIFAFNYRYLFKNTQQRTLGLNFNSYNLTNVSKLGAPVLHGEYILGGKKGDTFATPLANFLTRDVTVAPRNQFDGMVDLSFKWKGFSLDLGYDLFAKSEEDVSIKAWTEDEIGIADWSWDTQFAFINDGANVTIYNGGAGGASSAGTTNGSIQRLDLNPNAPKSPSLVTHKIFGGAGYICDRWKYPVMAGIGGSYEFITDNDGLETWALWAKLGVSF